MADVRGHFTHTPRPQLHAGPPLPAAAPGPATVPGRRGWPWPHGVLGSAGRDRARGRWGLLKACALGLSPGSTGSGSRRPRRQAWAGRVRRRKGEDGGRTADARPPRTPLPGCGPRRTRAPHELSDTTPQRCRRQLGHTTGRSEPSLPEAATLSMLWYTATDKRHRTLCRKPTALSSAVPRNAP